MGLAEDLTSYRDLISSSPWAVPLYGICVEACPKQGELKEVRFRPRTDDHDYEFKTKHAREFLEEGHKVKAWVQFRGRDIIYKDQGRDILDRFVEDLSDISKVDQAPTMEGRRMTMMLAPDKKK